MLVLTALILIGVGRVYFKAPRHQPDPTFTPKTAPADSIYAGNSTVVNSNPEYVNNDYGYASGEWTDSSR